MLGSKPKTCSGLSAMRMLFLLWLLQPSWADPWAHVRQASEKWTPLVLII